MKQLSFLDDPKPILDSQGVVIDPSEFSTEGTTPRSLDLIPPFLRLPGEDGYVETDRFGRVR